MQLKNSATLLFATKFIGFFSHFLDNIVKISRLPKFPYYIYAKFNWCAYT